MPSETAPQTHLVFSLRLPEVEAAHRRRIARGVLGKQSVWPGVHASGPGPQVSPLYQAPVWNEKHDTSTMSSVAPGDRGRMTRADITLKPIVLREPAMDDVVPSRDLAYASTEDATLTFDLYLPPATLGPAARLPLVILTNGYPDPGMQRVLGCRTKDMMSVDGWARLIACRGLAAVTYTCLEPARDVGSLLQHLVSHAGSLGLDASRVGAWACSGHAPTALGLLARTCPVPVACAAICYGYSMDVGGADAVASAAARFRFAIPLAGAGVPDLRTDAPLLLVRAGHDEMPRLNEALDRFADAAQRANLPVTVIDHETGRHAFDILDDSPRSGAVIREVLAFLERQLCARPSIFSPLGSRPA